MFTYSIRNIVHKQNDQNIDILYYPNNSIIDDIITSWNYNFYIPSINRTINNTNTTYVKNISLFEYDFILCHQINDQIIGISNNLHLPIVQYLEYGKYDTNKIPDQPNIYYIAEHDTQLIKNKIITIIPSVKLELENKNPNICMMINRNIDYGNTIQNIMSQIPNISLVDSLAINKKAIVDILINHKIVIDVNPTDIYKPLFCALAGVPYITINNPFTQMLKSVLDNISFIESDILLLKNTIDRFLKQNRKFFYALESLSSDEQELTKYLQKIKKLGLII